MDYGVKLLFGFMAAFALLGSFLIGFGHAQLDWDPITTGFGMLLGAGFGTWMTVWAHNNPDKL